MCYAFVQMKWKTSANTVYIIALKFGLFCFLFSLLISFCRFLLNINTSTYISRPPGSKYILQHRVHSLRSVVRYYVQQKPERWRKKKKHFKNCVLNNNAHVWNDIISLCWTLRLPTLQICKFIFLVPWSIFVGMLNACLFFDPEIAFFYPALSKTEWKMRKRITWFDFTLNIHQFIFEHDTKCCHSMISFFNRKQQ